MPHCRGIGPARAERRVGHTVHSHYSYLDGAPVWLCPGPSVGFCASISAICAFLHRLWGPRRRQNDWHFSGTTRGTVPRAFSCQWCALTLTKPERVEGGVVVVEASRRPRQETAAPTVLWRPCSSFRRYHLSLLQQTADTESEAVSSFTFETFICVTHSDELREWTGIDW